MMHISIKNDDLPMAKSPFSPRKGETTGVEVTTGPLAQGVATSVGLETQKRLKFHADVFFNTLKKARSRMLDVG